jgi:serralysin
LPSAAVQDNLREILKNIGGTIGLEFREINNPFQAEMRISLSDEVDYAAAYYPHNKTGAGIASDIMLNPMFDNVNDTNGFQNGPGSHGYMSMVHEVGHALGLKHPHDDSNNLPKEFDNTSHTVMTYNFTGEGTGTLMSYDVALLQDLYGEGNANAGDTFYEFTDIDEFRINGEEFITGDDGFGGTKLNIWDSSGEDTLDFSNLSYNEEGYYLDMNAGGWLIKNEDDQGDYFDSGTSLSFDMFIENINASSSSDEIILNSADNIIGGYNKDTIWGHDVISNDEVDDILNLSQFNRDELELTQDDNNLVIEYTENSTITITDYYANNNHLGIEFNDIVLA